MITLQHASKKGQLSHVYAHILAMEDRILVIFLSRMKKNSNFLFETVLKCQISFAKSFL